MAIVRNDKRPEALKLTGELNTQIGGLLLQANALQASLEALEVELGLASEGDQATRDQYMVTHYRKGDEVGHPVAECTDECAAVESLEAIGENEKDPES